MKKASERFRWPAAVVPEAMAADAPVKHRLVIGAVDLPATGPLHLALSRGQFAVEAINAGLGATVVPLADTRLCDARNS